jgi:hypothetical protein
MRAERATKKKRELEIKERKEEERRERRERMLWGECNIERIERIVSKKRVG